MIWFPNITRAVGGLGYYKCAWLRDLGEKTRPINLHGFSWYVGNRYYDGRVSMSQDLIA